MNNLEWLWEHDRERILRNLTMEDDTCYICPKHDVSNPDVCDSDGRCTEVMREWLLAEHDSNGTCPDGNGTCPNDGLAPENDVSADDVDANDGKISTMPLRMPSEIKFQYVHGESCNQVADQREHAETPPVSKWRSNDAQSDSREKLEADVRKFVYSKGWFDDGIEPDSKPYIMELFIEWLDRQATITEREINKANLDNWRKWCDEIGIPCTKERAGEQIAELTAERDRYRELCGKLLDAADEMRRVRDQFDAFTEVDR